MKKQSSVGAIATVVLSAGAVAIMVNTTCSRNNPQELYRRLSASVHETTCEQRVFPLIVTEIRNVRLLRSFRYEDVVTVGDTISGRFWSRLGMEVTYHLALNCNFDLSSFSSENVAISSSDGRPLEITVYLPQPTFSPVEVLETIERPIYTRNTDNNGEDIALMREYLLLNAKSTFQMNAMQANALGRAKQSAQETIGTLVEGILENHGIAVAVRVEFGAPLAITQSRNSTTQR